MNALLGIIGIVSGGIIVFFSLCLAKSASDADDKEGRG